MSDSSLQRKPALVDDLIKQLSGRTVGAKLNGSN